MNELIKNKLKQIEDSKNIKILFAIESGSRGWGFSSADSDFDVRFVYTKSRDNYLKINPSADFLDFPINEEVDMNGWDLKKFLKHLYVSNATPFEWIQSPVFYENNIFVYQEIFKILPKYFCQQTIIHHYLGLVKKKLEILETNNVKLKSLFYIIRSLLAAKYSLVKNEFPPMKFNKLIFLIDDENILKEIMYLRDRKTQLTESNVFEVSPQLVSFLKILYINLSIAEKIKFKGSFDENLINETYLKLLIYANNRLFKAEQSDSF